MCGIAGIVGSSPTDGWSIIGKHVLDKMRHRGPNDNGWMAYGAGNLRFGQRSPDDLPLQVLFLHTRLSIIDLSELGRQPMSTADGRFHITFNGEIYNYRELRTELESYGHRFCTETDTEVLLYAWRHWGVACLPRLVGMFAFAILDTAKRTVTLVRDFFGVKPLFYSRSKGALAFASEIKALFQVPWVNRRVNPPSFYRFLWHGADDHTPETMFDEVMQLPPAHYMQVRDKSVKAITKTVV